MLDRNNTSSAGINHQVNSSGTQQTRQDVVSSPVATSSQSPVVATTQIKTLRTTMMTKENSSANNIFGFPLKYVALVALTFQTSAATLLTRYARNTTTFSAPVTVLLTEVVKFGASLFLIRNSKLSVGDPPIALMFNLTNPNNLKLAVPALLYTLQNNLIYVSLTNLEATTFQVCYQSKVILTALMSILLLGRSFTNLKWASLVLLTLGIIMTQLTSSSSGVKNHSGSAAKQFLGLVAVCSASTCSALAGVYFERLLKGAPQKPDQSKNDMKDVGKAEAGEQGGSGAATPTAPGLTPLVAGAVQQQQPPQQHPSMMNTSIWYRNAQLAFFSLIVAVVGLFYTEQDSNGDLIAGFTPAVWMLVLVQAGGGLIIALVIKFADNVLKGFATAISIIVCGVFSSFYFQFLPTPLFILGCLVVICATMMYSY